eukprot:4754695-Pleurochrysis_carterae.AAC.1
MMSGINNSEGVEQTVKALRALERPRKQTDPRLKEEEELALKQVISGINPNGKRQIVKEKRGYSPVQTMDGGNDELGENTDKKIATKNEQK